MTRCRRYLRTLIGLSAPVKGSGSASHGGEQGLKLFSLFSNDFQNLPATPRDTDATWNTSFAACVRRTSRTLSYDWMSNGYLSAFPVR
jgi:hypothetical protein